MEIIVSKNQIIAIKKLIPKIKLQNSTNPNFLLGKIWEWKVRKLGIIKK